jgi:hypothetical protein
MTIISRLFGRGDAMAASPWTRVSIYALILTHVDPSTGTLRTTDLSLPDEESTEGTSKVRFAAGAFDGVFGGPPEQDTGGAETRRLAKLIVRLAQTGDSRSVHAAYSMLRDNTALNWIDSLIQLLRDSKMPIQPHFERFALQLASESADRNAVKTGIALLGAFQLSQHSEVVSTLGLHEELTLFSAVALKNMFPDSAMELWSLAKRVTGWGRIQTVRFLIPTENREIQYWLRTEGFRNSIMNEYLALIAAVHGKLKDALEQDVIPESELVAASELIDALIASDGGPAEGMNAYSDGAATCCAYLGHASKAAKDLRHLLTAHAIVRYLTFDSLPPAAQLANGWTEAAISVTATRARELIGIPGWDSVVRNQLESADREAFFRASRAADEIGLDAFDWHWRRLNANTQEPSHWYFVMAKTNAERIEDVVSLAEQKIPLHLIETGAGNSVGLGYAFAPHSCLDFVVQDLKRFPGQGFRLIEAAIQSPVVRNRNIALNALEAWEGGHWTPRVLEVVERARRSEPDEKVLARINKLVNDRAKR